MKDKKIAFPLLCVTLCPLWLKPGRFVGLRSAPRLPDCVGTSWITLQRRSLDETQWNPGIPRIPLCFMRATRLNHEGHEEHEMNH